MRQTLYIAGPMTGLPDYNRPAFDQAEAHLVAIGYLVLNPARHQLGEDARWADYMRLGIRDVTRADGIALLPGWTASIGATVEHNLATTLGIPAAPVTQWTTTKGWDEK